MAARRQEGWTRQSPSSWQSSQGYGGQEPEGYKEWCRHDTRGHTTETGGASSSVEERRSQVSGKKHISHTSGNPQCKNSQYLVRRPLEATKKPKWEGVYQTQADANDKVWDLDRKPETAPDTIAILYAGFEKVSRDVGEVDQMFDKEFEEMQDALKKAKETQRFVEIAWRTVHDRREDQHTLFRDYEDAENPLERGAGLYSRTGWRYGRGDECTVLRNERQGQ